MDVEDQNIHPVVKTKSDDIELPEIQATNEEFDETRVKKLIRKVDLRLLPYLTLLYLFSFLDRVNIGFARVYRMEEELHLTPDQYSWTLSIFFVGYVLFEVPSNLLLKKVTPPRWIARIMVTWGAITMALAAVKNFEGLMAGRFFLGVSEAGLFPGLIYFLSFWYTRKEQGLRIALFYSAASLAGAFSGLLAYGISYIDQHGGLSGWQWIFIIEGLPSVIIGIATWWLLPSTPNHVKWLTQPERDYLAQRLMNDHTDSGTKVFRKEQFKEAFTDYKVYLYMLSYFGFVCPLYAMAQLLPTIIAGMQFGKLASLLLTAPPYAVGVFTTIALAYHSDKKMERCFHFITSISIGAIGFLIMAVVANNHVKYFGAFLAVMGIATSLPIHLSWLNNNMLGSTKAGTASAMVVSFGNVGGIVAGQMYRISEAPAFTPSHLTNMAFMIMSLVVALVLRYGLSRENAKLAAMANTGEFKVNERSDGLDVTNFRFTL
ncbi:MFS general substrate transporter [Conidiobolus coronatus NRRL 28638]|uniref:MFS general substrate transporter n=1 Tax=Conidiobolus coronatus (strain ATCC 28846 / CBS 209.66 / NRRL 28638) TaxID=796925 RepID=A0A137PF98_CONC2|nr:MFS general substrate transporter [Conidiobolus coronatus NRRL 28638]|eukprot:KXN73679.1 MFS general substrate transporter [Conidiobolus coronatus NRRL 28638]